MRILRFIPNYRDRSKVLALADARGIPAIGDYEWVRLRIHAGSGCDIAGLGAAVSLPNQATGWVFKGIDDGPSLLEGGPV
jgi:hypothetical protein